MRISTRMIYDQGSSQLNNLQGALNRTQMQLSANRRNLTPADDPIASARALEVTQSQSINTQFVTNRSNAKNFLSQEELALASTTSLIADVKDLVLKAGNPSLKDVDRDTLARELEGRLTDLLGIANTADGAGGYLFSGYKSTTQPFSQTPTGASYVGDQGQRELQVGSARYLATSDSGATVLENNSEGNGKFTTAAATANFARGGSGVISGGTVTDPSALTGHKYSIDFKVTGTGTDAVTTYTVTDATLGQTVPNPAVPIPAAGRRHHLGRPASEHHGQAGRPGQLYPGAERQGIVVYHREKPDRRAAPVWQRRCGPGAPDNGLNAAHNILDTAYDNVLSVRADVGSRMKELDYLDSAGDDLDIQYATTLSDLQDLDMVKAISTFSQQQVTLQAAQKSFTSISGLSLFNYIN